MTTTTSTGVENVKYTIKYDDDLERECATMAEEAAIRLDREEAEDEADSEAIRDRQDEATISLERLRKLYEMKQNAQANEPWDVNEIYVPEWVLSLCDWFQARKKARWERRQQ